MLKRRFKTFSHIFNTQLTLTYGNNNYLCNVEKEQRVLTIKKLINMKTNKLHVYAYVFRCMNLGEEPSFELRFMDTSSMKEYYTELCQKYDFVHVFKHCL